MSIEELTGRLLARTGRGATYGLERIQQALDTLGRPERELDIVHVAGTNGKGSVCAMLDAMIRAAGRSVGVFTSPHLCRINERIRLHGRPIDDERFAVALEAALGAEPQVTFFEAMTIAGFVAMCHAKVDIAVFEVGLGGRLDATNVIRPPLCAVITTIGRDHTRLLGEDLADIAREKSGIIKEGSPLVIGAMDDEPREAIIEQARLRRSGAITVVARSEQEMASLQDRGLRVVLAVLDGDAIVLRGAVEARIDKPSLSGRHQGLNAAAAAAAATQLGVPRRAIEQGLAHTHWPGRLERMTRDGVTILLDCAHNLHAARALDAALVDLTPSRGHLVFGALGDKQWRGMLELIGPRADHRHYCPPLEELAGRLPVTPAEFAAVLPGTAHASKLGAFDAALTSALPGDTVVVTGSIFLVGAVRSHLTGEASDPAIPL